MPHSTHGVYCRASGYGTMSYPLARVSSIHRVDSRPTPRVRFRGGQHPCSERDGPLPDAAGSPSLLVGEGVRGRGETALRNTPNRTFAHMSCPPLNRVRGGCPRASGGGGRHCAGMTPTPADVIGSGRREWDGTTHPSCTTPPKGRGVSKRGPAEHGMAARFRFPSSLGKVSDRIDGITLTACITSFKSCFVNPVKTLSAAFRPVILRFCEGYGDAETIDRPDHHLC
jgi:hypothetical protein